MYMETLHNLHRDMLRKNIDIQKFKIKMRAVEFVCIFSVRVAPFDLSLTTRGENPDFFLFDVVTGYNISARFEFYKELARVLRLDGRSGNKLYPSEFLKQLNQKISSIADIKEIPSSSEIARLRKTVEERDKGFFNTWARLGNGPTEKNLYKTRELLGYEAYQYSKRTVQSSVWSVTDMGHSWKR